MNYYGRRRYYSSRYPRRSSRRTYSTSSRSKRRAIGNYRAALSQTDKTDVNLSMMTKLYTFNGKVPNHPEMANGVGVINVWDLLRRSSFYKSYANMYDQIKLNSVRLKLTPNYFKTTATENTLSGSLYNSYTVVTAWDRTGLNFNQCQFVYNTQANDQVIGGLNDNFGFYVTMTNNEVATYSSAVTKAMSPNSNTTIVRTLYPNTISEKAYYVNTSELNPWYVGIDKEKGRYYGIVKPGFVKGKSYKNVPDENAEVIEVAETPLMLQSSDAVEKNPSWYIENAIVPFRPTLLVALLNDTYTISNSDNQDIEVVPTAEFTVEADLGVTFRGLRKCPIIE